MSAARYTGPERREDGHAEVLARLDEIQKHFDTRLVGLEAKVAPIYEYWVTAKTGVTVIKWVVLVVGPIIGMWATIKGWLIGLLIKP